MKSKPEKKQTLKLKVDDQIRYKLLGISCHENDYRLVWAINSQLNMQFVRIDNLVVHHQKLMSDLEFSRFAFPDEGRYLTYELISNRCPDGFLFPEIKNFDFLIKITGEIASSELQDFSRKMKAIDIVSAVFILQPGKLRGIGQIFQE